jgi:hypothetical protein
MLMWCYFSYEKKIQMMPIMTKLNNSNKVRTITRALGLSCATLMSVLAFACGGFDGSGERKVFDTGQGAKVPQFDGHSRYSIKAYVPTEDGEYQLMELSPQNAAYAQQQAGSAENGAGESTSASDAGEGSAGASSPSGDGDEGPSFKQKGQNLEAEEEDPPNTTYYDASLHQLVAWAFGWTWSEKLDSLIQ